MIKTLRVLFLQAAVTMSLTAQINVVANRYDQFTTGANPHEIALNPADVKTGTFGRLYSYYVDGAVYAQPLYLSSVQVSGKGKHNVLYVATMNDKVYAFDADRSGPPLWMRSFTDEQAGITPVPIPDITNNNDLNLVGNIGVESTPVIDPAEGSMFVVARTRENGAYVQRLHRLDIHDGRDVIPSVVIEASVQGSANDAIHGEVHFDPKAGNQRPALALVHGVVVIAWASHEDLRPYHGWVMAYDARTLKQVGVLCTTPDTADGGIWQSGRGPAVDTDGDIYFEVGNGGWDGKRNFGNSVIQLKIDHEGLAIHDYFTPAAYDDLNKRDADVGSTGPLLIPGTNILIGGNKNGVIFLLNSDRLGRMTSSDAGVRQNIELNAGRVMAGPVLWNGPEGLTLLIWCETGFPEAFRFNGNSLQRTPVAKGTVGSHGSPGGALTVSSDGQKPDTGILWATVTNGKSADHGNAAGVLHAFDAESLKELWNSEQSAKRDRLGTLVKFVPPLVAAGKVYIPNYDNAVNVYGLLKNAETH
ncbi:MAG TPA: hypothetical protein VLT36_17085 [Candidatus Dormibacteraeota bacterium]|nr:hypothetical protein [Candidatus Dormibacteraeota bacterium]